MQRLLTEPLISFAAAAKACPGRPCVRTIWRWANHGVRGVTLESVKVAGRRFTSEAALRRFIARTNGEADQAVAKADTERLAKIDAELDAEGIV